MDKNSSAEKGLSSPESPLFPDVGVINLVPEAWGGIWLSRHQILTRLSRYFNILWFNPPREWRELRSGEGNSCPYTESVPRPSNGFIVHSHSKWLPVFYRPSFLAKTTASLRFRAAGRILREMGCDKTILYVWRDQYVDSLDLAKYDISCYHITDEYSFSEIETPLRKSEFDLISRVDQIFIHSPALLEKKGGINPNTLHVPNGVDYPTFSADCPEPADLAAIPHPRVGYVGRIKMQLDWDVLAALVSSHPEYSFVFVGPIVYMGDKTDKMKSLFAKENVHYLGNRSVADMAAYMQYMDVCLLCYPLNDYTKYIFPLKVNEYLAAGTPVVGSNIRSLRGFSSVVRIVQTPDEWSSAIAESLTPEARSRSSIEKRRAVAREYDWSTLVHKIAASLCEHLGEEYSARLSTVHDDEMERQVHRSGEQ